MSTATSGQAATAVRDKQPAYLAILNSDWLLVVLPVASIALWTAGLAGVDPRSMNSLGLVSLLGPTNVLALLLLAAGLIVGLYRDVRERLWR